MTHETFVQMAPAVTSTPPAHMHASLPGSLQSRNVRIHKRRTSIRLEPKMWSALSEIATLENCSIHDICGAVHDLKEPETSFTAALRVFMMEYYRSASRSNPHVVQVQKQAKAYKNSVKG